MKQKAPAGMSRARKKAKRVNRQDLTLRNLAALHKRFDRLEVRLGILLNTLNYVYETVNEIRDRS